MRVLCTFILVSLLLSCKKEKPVNPDYSRFVGTWEYEKHMGFIFDSLPPGNGHLLIIGQNGELEQWLDSLVLYKGSYNLQERQDCSYRTNQLFFSTTDTSFASDSYIEIVNGKLTFTTSDCIMDGGTTSYRRVNAIK